MEKTSHNRPQPANDGRCDHDKRHDRKSPTYQEALDEAIEESFPASDPIAAEAAEKADRKISTPKDDKDWVRQHEPGTKKAPDPNPKKGKN